MRTRATTSSVEHAIVLHDAHDVRAVLDGRKTQHRVPVARLVSLVNGHGAPPGLWDALDLSRAWVDPGPSPAGNLGPYLKAPTLDGDCVHRVYSRVQVGDRLWLREPWALYESERHNPFPDLASRPGAGGRVFYRTGFDRSPLTWRRATHMPRWASRLSLEVTELRAERVQSITDEDARAEGVTALGGAVAGVFVTARAASGTTAVECFRRCWDARHYRRGLGWETNPFVWVYTFRRGDA